MCKKQLYLIQNEELRPWRLNFPIRWQQLQQFSPISILLQQGRTRELEQGPKWELRNKRLPRRAERKKYPSYSSGNHLWKKGWSLCPKHELKKDGVCAQNMSYSTPNLLAKVGNEFFHCQAGRNTGQGNKSHWKTWAACCT